MDLVPLNESVGWYFNFVEYTNGSESRRRTYLMIKENFESICH